MAGHSHWKTIKYKKSATDAQKSKAFSKIARAISVAAREMGPDPNTNPKLRTAIEQARRLHMPTENIERAISRATGEAESTGLEEILVEAYGPGGIALIIEGITDNKNRALGEIKHILNQHNAKLATEGSVRWMFERKGILKIQTGTGMKNSELEMLAIDAGAQDIHRHNDLMEIYTKGEELGNVKKILEEKGVKVEDASIEWIAKEYKKPTPQERALLEKLFTALDENDAVQEIYSNVERE